MNTREFIIKSLARKDFPKSLEEIPGPPKKLNLVGILPKQGTKLLTVVGSRKYSPYGKAVCEKIISELSGYDISIVSGLALGIDAIAHRAAINAQLHTIAVPGSGLNLSILYPRSNVQLAQEIVHKGGCLLSEYENDFRATKWSFPQRNRLMAGLSDATLIVETSERSGTLITARLALDYNRQVFSIPGSIFDLNSTGCNNLIKRGATPVTCGADILDALNIDIEEKSEYDYNDCSSNEKELLSILLKPLSRSAIYDETDLSIDTVNEVLMTLEIKGYLKEVAGKIIRI